MKLILYLHRFQRVFEAGSGVEYEEAPITFNPPAHSDEVPPCPSGWASIFRYFRPQNTSDVDVEAQLCRPVQNQVSQIPRRVTDDTSKIFIERNQLLINGN